MISSKPVGHWPFLAASTAALGIALSPLQAQQPSEAANESTESSEEDRRKNPNASPELGAANTVSYPRSFFDEFRPTNAQDMMGRVPGFQFNGGDNDVRGLAGSSGNVLIDGQRPVTKSLGLADIIRRIPASAVVRVDVIRGGAAGIDMQGQTIVANIIRDPRGFASATIEMQSKIYADHWPARNPRAEGSWSKGDWSASGALGWRDEREQGNAGRGDIRRRDLLTGVGSGHGSFENAFDRSGLTGNGTLEWRHGPDLARVNLSGRRETDQRSERVRIAGPSGVGRREFIAQNQRETAAEASLDYERIVSSSLTSRAMLLKRSERGQNQSNSEGRGVPQQGRDKSLEKETIGRFAMTIIPGQSLTVETAAEVSANSRDTSTSLVRGGAAVLLPSANLGVSERRGNFTGFARWQAAAWGSIEVGVGYELSTIRQKGDVQQSKRLRYWKPRAIATIDPAPNWQVRLRAERVIGQLDFGDFAANVSLEPGVTSAGNPALVPETSWITEAALERRFWGEGALTLTAAHYQIKDAFDLVPIDNRFDAPGNIGGGWRREVRASLTLPTERLGLAGGQIRINTNMRSSRVTDPVTGLKRRRSDERRFVGDLTATKDFSALRSVLGLELFTGFDEVSYRLFERRRERSTADPLTRLYWDYVPSTKTAFRFQIENFTFRKRSRERISYSGPRSASLVSSTEYRDAVLMPFLMVRVRRQF